MKNTTYRNKILKQGNKFGDVFLVILDYVADAAVPEESVGNRTTTLYRVGLLPSNLQARTTLNIHLLNNVSYEIGVGNLQPVHREDYPTHSFKILAGLCNLTQLVEKGQMTSEEFEFIKASMSTDDKTTQLLAYEVFSRITKFEKNNGLAIKKKKRVKKQT